jgi:hypothetical protein
MSEPNGGDAWWNKETTRARELADRLLDGRLEGKPFTEWIAAALQRERDEAAERAESWLWSNLQGRKIRPGDLRNAIQNPEPPHA